MNATSPPLRRRSPSAFASARRGAAARRAGMTMVELIIAAGIISVLLLASAAAMGKNVESSNTSRQLVRGAVFLESVQEDLAALSPAEVLALNGQTLFSDADNFQGSRYRVEISSFNAAASLVRIELRLVDQVRGHAVASVHTMRAIV